MKPWSWVRGRRGNRLGAHCERVVYRAALDRRRRWPTGWEDIRFATPEEDARGVDLVVVSTAGDVPVQVKAGHGGSARHRRRHPDVPLVAGVRYLNEEEVWQRLVAVVLNSC